MYHVSAQNVDERMINVHYYYYSDVIRVLLSIFLHPKKTIFVESAYVLLFPCVSSHW